PGPVVGGHSVTGTVALTAPAPGSGLTVSLSSNNAAAGVPASVAVPGGASSTTFTVTTFPVSSVTPVTITASYAGVTKTANLNVNPPAAASLTLAPNPVQGGNDSIGTVTLNGAAPASGISVALTSSNRVASVPATVMVPSGATSAQFT